MVADLQLACPDMLPPPRFGEWKALPSVLYRVDGALLHQGWRTNPFRRANRFVAAEATLADRRFLLSLVFSRVLELPEF